jgi:sugar lactone lactonase YvrE
MPKHPSVVAMVSAVAALVAAVPAGALYRIDTFAGRGYGDGGPAIAAAVIEPSDAVTDAAGNVYFADTGEHLVRRVDAATGTITTVAGNGAPASAGDGGPATLANLFDPEGVALDATGQTLYIVENLGARVRRVDLASGIITTFAGTGVFTGSIDGEGGDPTDDLGDGGLATAASFNQPVGVTLDADGNVYVSERSESWPDASQHRPRIRRIDHATGIITTFAGGLPEGYNGEGHPALQTQLADPIGLEFDGSGNLYFGELGNSRIRKIAAGGGHVITTVAGNGSFPEPNDSTLVPFHEGGLAVNASLHRPVRVALVPRGCGGPSTPPCEVYFGDSGHHCVRKIDTQGNLTTVVNGPPGPDTSPIAGDSGDGGPALAARLMTPAALLGPNDKIVIVDDAANRVRLYDPADGTIRAFAGTGEGGYGGDGGPAVRALLDRPTGLAVDGGGNVYVADHNNFVVRRVGADAARTMTTFAGNGQRGVAGDGGPAAAAEFDQPTGLTFTGAGDLLVTDARTQTVRRIDGSGTISPFVGQGYVEGFAGDGGPATAASLDTPLRTAVSASGDVFIADFNNNRIRRVDASGTITTFAAGINLPAALAFGADGTLYVAEFGGERILVVDAGGGVHPFAGTGGRSPSIADAGDGGPVSAATFADPTGISFDADGSLLVADQGNNVIRRIALDGTGKLSPASIVTTIAGDGRPTYGGDGGNALAASLNRPTEALALSDGRILIADRGNQRVRIITPVQSLCDASCDDGDPCTADTCDPTAGCMHAPAKDTDGDGVCDGVDNCPTVPNPNQGPNDCPGGGGGTPGSACLAGNPSCIPGTGGAKNECLVETVVQGAQGTPVVRCTDGDPTCDADPAPGRCAFTLAWCFNNADPRLHCTATGLKRVAVRAAMSPHSAARTLVGEMLAAVATVAGGTPKRAAVVFAPPFTGANACTASMPVEVAVRTSGKRSRPGKAVLQVTGKAAGRGADVDRVKLLCMP